MAATVEIFSLEFVKPSSPTFHSLPEIKFSALDQVAGSMVSRVVFFYENQTTNSSAPSIEIESARKAHLLKQSLSFILTKFYPFAGRMNGSRSIICDNTGVPYLEAKLNATLLEAFQDTVPDKIGIFLPPHPLSTDLIRNFLPLALQVTYFQCGGIAIGVCISHRISDGSPGAMFLGSWASTCRGEELLIDDTRLDIGSELFPPTVRGLNILTVRANNDDKKKMVRKRFVFDREKIFCLKRIVSSHIQNASRVEVVSAFIFKNIFDSIRIKHSNKVTFVASVAIDLRKRLSPPVSSLALGNFVVGKQVSLRRDEEIDYGDLVGRFRDTMKGSGEGRLDYVKHLYESIKAMHKSEVWACMFTSWCGFPFYGLDFGWGNPLLVCPKSSYPIVNLLNSPDGEGMEAWIHLAEDDMSMLSAEFLSLATCRNNPNGVMHSRL